MTSALRQSLEVIRTSSTLWWRDWVKMALLNLGWALCVVTLVLGPPATFSLYRATKLIAGSEVIDIRELLRTLPRDFLKSWLWLLVTGGSSLVILLVLRFYSQLDTLWAAGFHVVSLLLLLFWAALQLYVLPFLIEQEKYSLRQAFKNAFFTLLASPVYTGVLAGAVALLLILGSRFPFLFFVGLPCLIAMLGTCAVQERLTTFNIRPRDET
jgi:uncharacterized membrane protein YesL